MMQVIGSTSGLLKDSMPDDAKSVTGWGWGGVEGGLLNDSTMTRSSITAEGMLKDSMMTRSLWLGRGEEGGVLS